MVANIKKLLLGAAAFAFGVALATTSGAQTQQLDSGSPPTDRYYLPSPKASRFVSVTPTGSAEAELTVLTQGVAEKETGPSEVVTHFGEIYTFVPSFLILHRDEPTDLSFWNLQHDDEHDVMLVAPDLSVLMKVLLAPLSKTSYVFTFHREGLFTFRCTFHQPAMSGQILVLPPRSTAKR
jgi:plastocyanin